MKKCILFALHVYFIIGLAEESVEKINQTAYAFGKVHDYERAINLYSDLLKYPLPAWEKSRVIYNLGTMYLFQNHPRKALELFGQIDPQTLSIPNYARDLFINEGLAFFSYAEQLKLSGDHFWESQKFLLKKSLQSFKKAQELECLVQQKEEPSSKCESNQLIDSGKGAVQQFLISIQEELAKEWLKEAGYKSQEALSAAFESAKPREQLCLNIQLLLLQDPPSLKDLEQLLKGMNALENDQNNFIENLKNILQLSEEHLKKNESEQSLFYLILASGICTKEESEKAQKSSSKLKNALIQAERVMKLTYLWLLMPEEIQNEKKWIDFLQKEHARTLSLAALFIPAVLQDQEKKFKNPSSCSSSLWYQVIPLFDQGYDAAEKTSKFLQTLPLINPEIIGKEISTVKNWREALNLLLKPPPQSSDEQLSNRPSSRDMGESLRLIQEMYLQDQQRLVPEKQEFHSW